MSQMINPILSSQLQNPSGNLMYPQQFVNQRDLTYLNKLTSEMKSYDEKKAKSSSQVISY